MTDYTPYLHRVCYYETDCMRVAHHSNYVRWMEEARVDFLRRNGVDYAELERRGVIIPMAELSGKYLRSLRFDDVVAITTRCTYYNAVRVRFRYEMRNAAGELSFSGETQHCFLDQQLRPVNLRKRLPDVDQMIMTLVE